jgi:hypothetical protein
MSNAEKRAKRDMLYAERDGLCHWCGIKTVIPPRGVILKQQPDNMATLDHLDDRLSGRRGKMQGTRRVVLSCYRCNQARSRESVALHNGRVELWCHG